MKILHSVHPQDFKGYQTEQISERFQLSGLVQPNQVNCVYTHYDRMIVGVAHPLNETISLENYPNLRAGYFLERREMGIINVAGEGEVIADGQAYTVNKMDCLYIGKGVKKVEFLSKNIEKPAIFYLLSCPAHKEYPTRLMSNEDAVKVHAGDNLNANDRMINKYIHAGGIQSCQLVMGLTVLAPGSVWNTMPPHVHDRRMEAYFYFDVAEGHKVFHYMGEPDATRHLLLGNNEAVVSPPWSIHSGCGTSNYSFIWGMAGENLDYTDMDAVAITDIR